MIAFKILWHIVGVELAVRSACIPQELNLAAEHSLLKASKFLVPLAPTPLKSSSSFVDVENKSVSDESGPGDGNGGPGPGSGGGGGDKGNMKPEEVITAMAPKREAFDKTLTTFSDGVDNVKAKQKEMMGETRTLNIEMNKLTESENDAEKMLEKAHEEMTQKIDATRGALKEDAEAVKKEETETLEQAVQTPAGDGGKKSAAAIQVEATKRQQETGRQQELQPKVDILKVDEEYQKCIEGVESKAGDTGHSTNDEVQAQKQKCEDEKDQKMASLAR